MPEKITKRCPHDGGYCHHTCAYQVNHGGECFRESGGMNLTTPHEGFPLEGHTFPAPGKQTPTNYAELEMRAIAALGYKPNTAQSFPEHWMITALKNLWQRARHQRKREQELMEGRKDIYLEYSRNADSMDSLAKKGTFPKHERAWQMPWQLRRIFGLRESANRIDGPADEIREAIEDSIIGELDELLDDLACLPWWRRLFLGKTRKMIEERQERVWS